MLELNMQQKLSASKKLSKLKLNFGDDLMQLDTYWCRIAFVGPFSDVMHHHSFFEVHYVLEGYTDFVFEDGKKIHLQPGEFILLPPRCAHRIVDVSEECKKFVFAFFVSFNPDNADSAYFEQLYTISEVNPVADTEDMKILVDNLLRHAHEMRPSSIASINYSLRLILCEVTSILFPDVPNVLSVSKKDKYIHHRDLVENVHFFVSSNIDKSITGKNIAEQFNISMQQLNRILLQEEGYTVSQLITNTRTELIRSLLENTSYPLKFIASRAGFSNEYNMARFFKREEGISPGLYRKSLYDYKP